MSFATSPAVHALAKRLSGWPTDPREKPMVPARFNPDHPLAPDFCLIPGLSGSSKLIDLSTGTEYAVPSGDYVDKDGLHSSTAIDLPLSLIQTATGGASDNAISFHFRVMEPSDTGGDYFIGNATANSGTLRVFKSSGTSRTILGEKELSGTDAEWSVSPAFTYGIPFVLTMTYEGVGGSCYGYIDGVKYGSGASSGVSRNHISTNWRINGAGGSKTYDYVYIYKRELSDAEAYTLHEDPYCFLEPEKDAQIATISFSQVNGLSISLGSAEVETALQSPLILNDPNYREVILGDRPVAYWRLGDTWSIDNLSDDFTGTDNDPPDPGLWDEYITGTPEGSTLDIDGNALFQEIFHTSANVQWAQNYQDFYVTGDFDISVDFSALTINGTQGAAKLTLNGIGEVVAFYDSTNQFQSNINGTANYSRTNNSGSLRIERVGTTIKTYTKDGAGSWVLRQTNTSGPTADTNVNLLVGYWSIVSDGHTNVKWDNLVVQATGPFYRRNGKILDELEAYDMVEYNSPSYSTAGLIEDDPDKAVDFTASSSEGLHRDIPPAMEVQTLSLECWFETSSTANMQMVNLSPEGAGNDGRGCYIRILSGTVAFLLGDADGSWHVVSSPLSTYADGNPHHVVATWDDTTARIYIDGSQVVADATWGSSIEWGDRALGSGPTDGQMYISGSRSNVAGTVPDNSFFDGIIDEVAIYDHVLTADQVEEHYAYGIGQGSAGILLDLIDAEGSGNNFQAPESYDTAVLDDTPLCYWRLGDLAPTESAFIYEDTFPIDGPVNPDRWSYAQQGFGPKPISGGKVEVRRYSSTDLYWLTSAQQFSGDVEIIMQWSGLTDQDLNGDNMNMLIGGVGTSDIRYLSKLYLNTIRGTDGSTNNDVTLAWTAGWFRIQRIGTGADSIKLYYKQNEGDSWTQLSSFTDVTGNADLYLQIYCNGTNHFDVEYIYIEADGSSQYTPSRHAFDQKLVQQLRAFNSPPPGTSLLFNDSDPSTDFTDASSMGFYGDIPSAIKDQTFSAEAWFSTTDATFNTIIAVFPQGSGNDGRGFYVYLNNTGTIYASLGDASGSFNTVSHAGGYNDGDAHHVVLTWDGTNQLLYVDGSEVASDSTWGSSVSWVNAFSGPTDGKMYIGAFRDNTTGIEPNSGYFEGTIDEVALYERALTPAEILDHYKKGIGDYKVDLAVTLDHALSNADALAIDAVLSAITKTLGQAAADAIGIAITSSLGPVSKTLDEAIADTSAESVTAVSGPISKTLDEAVADTDGASIASTLGPVSYTFDQAIADAEGVSVESLQAGITFSIGQADADTESESISSVLGPVSKTLGPAETNADVVSVVFSAGGLSYTIGQIDADANATAMTSSLGPVTKVLGQAIVYADGQPLAAVLGAISEVLEDAVADTGALDITYIEPGLAISLDTSDADTEGVSLTATLGPISKSLGQADAYGDGIDIPYHDPGIIVSLNASDAESSALALTALQGPVSHSLGQAISDGNAVSVLAQLSSVSITLPAASGDAIGSDQTISLGGLVASLNEAVSDALAVPPITVIGGFLLDLGDATGEGDTTPVLDIELSSLTASMGPATAEGGNVDMVGVASAIAASLGNAVSEAVAQNIESALSGFTVSLGSADADTDVSEITVDSVLTGINIGVADAQGSAVSPTVGLGDLLLDLGEAVVFNYSPEITVTISFAEGSIDQTSIVLRFTGESVIYRVAQRDAVLLEGETPEAIVYREEFASLLWREPEPESEL